MKWRRKVRASFFSIRSANTSIFFSSLSFNIICMFSVMPSKMFTARRILSSFSRRRGFFYALVSTDVQMFEFLVCAKIVFGWLALHSNDKHYTHKHTQVHTVDSCSINEFPSACRVSEPWLRRIRGNWDGQFETTCMLKWTSLKPCFASHTPKSHIFKRHSVFCTCEMAICNGNFMPLYKRR